MVPSPFGFLVLFEVMFLSHINQHTVLVFFFFPLDHVSEAFQPCLLQPGNGHIVYLHLALSLDACVASRFIISEAEAKICFLSGYNENNMDSYISNTQQSWRRGNSHTVTLFPPRFPTYPLLEDSFCF